MTDTIASSTFFELLHFLNDFRGLLSSVTRSIKNAAPQFEKVYPNIQRLGYKNIGTETRLTRVVRTASTCRSTIGYFDACCTSAKITSKKEAKNYSVGKTWRLLEAIAIF